MGKDIYKKGLILLGIIVVAIITFLGYSMQKNSSNIEPYDESEINESEKEKSEKEKKNEAEESFNQEEEKIEAFHIFIDISGAVKNPGIYELNEGARLNDAIEVAGGFTEDSNADYIAKNLNKARILNDEEKIYIPFKTDDLSQIENTVIDNSKNTNSANTNTSKDNIATNTKININTASKEQLMTLKGIGEAYAQRIIDYRQEKKF